MDRYAKSREYLEQAKRVTPGAAQTLSKMPARFPQGAFPVALSHGLGARAWDVDGNVYIDWIGALGAIPLGYRDNYVTDAINAQGGMGAMSLPGPEEAELAERLCSKIPCAEMVRFVNSGSEATEAAIRTARIATGRDVILTVKSGYHSWHSWFQAVKDWHPGVPVEYERVIKGFQYNDLESLQSLVYANSYSEDSNQIAAIILEPCLFEKPKDGFLQEIRDLCTRYGIVLIFDEMVTGYRWRLAGGQEYFNITPDLATFGKGMANGLPIGMLCGKREYMQHAELISGTFGGNALSLAAANAVLDVYENEPVIDTMWKRGEELQDYFNGKCKELNVNAECDGYSVKPRVKFNTGNSETDLLAMSLLLQECASNGALLHYGGLNVCYALTDKDMDVTFRALNVSLEIVRDCISSNRWDVLRGEKIKPVVTVRK